MISFSFFQSRIPQIYFGQGEFRRLPDILSGASPILLITGTTWFRSSPYGKKLLQNLEQKEIHYSHVTVSGEPSPDLIDRIVSENKNREIVRVLAVGGGSVLDTGKAVSAMLLKDTSVSEYLEGVGSKNHDGTKVPFIAVPTTAGTGSEATKNAVLSRVGPGGFKKSIRHDNFIPDIAVVDPELMCSCSPEVTASCGMDAFTQLLESYVSSKANPFTDALAWSGMEYLKNALIPSYEQPDNIIARTEMAYAAMLSGITLANAGLGIVHGFASSIGGLFPISHGVICGTLVKSATKVNISSLKKKGDHQAKTHLKKYAKVGFMLAGRSWEEHLDTGIACLLEVLEEWTERLHLPTLERFGLKPSDFPKILSLTEHKNNPITLTQEEMEKILRERVEER